MKKIYIAIFVAFVQFSTLQAQSIMSLEDACNIALKNNYGILTAQNSKESAKINNTQGNAGMLPTIQAVGGASYALNNSYQKLSTGANNHFSAVSTGVFNADVELNWTVYDGGKMYVTKNKLDEIEALGELQFKEKVLGTIYELTADYFDVVRQKQQLKSINEVINYNNERVKIAQTGFNAGTIAKTELLQAQIDLNAALSNAVTQQYSIDNAKITLNRVLGRNPNDSFDVPDSIPDVQLPDRKTLTDKINASNISLLTFQQQIKIADLSLQENEKTYLPKISVKGALAYTQTINSEGMQLNNRNIGPQIAATLQVPIYTAGENQRKIEIAQLEKESAELDLNNAKYQLNNDLDNLYSNFENQLKLLQIEQNNISLTKENLNISLERLKYGQTTSLEIHLAQDLYMQSCTRLVNIQYSLKAAETKLKQLAAEL